MVKIMCINSSVFYGYGFKCDFSEDKLIEFVKLHKETFCKIAEKDLYEEIINVEGCELARLLSDYNYCCDLSKFEGLGSIVSNVMTNETGITFGYFPKDVGCGVFGAILFLMEYPWDYNEKEKNLKRKNLKEICKKYMNELNIIDKPHFINLGYYE